MTTRTPPTDDDAPTEHLRRGDLSARIPGPRPAASDEHDEPTPTRARVSRWTALPTAVAGLVGALAAVAQILDYLDGKTALLIVAAGLVLAVAPMAPLLRRGQKAVPAAVAVLLCLLIAVGGVVTGYGLRGGFVPGTPWAPGLTGNAGPRIPDPANAAPAPTPPAPDSIDTAPARATTPVALTDGSRTDLVVDHNAQLGLALEPVTVAGRPLTDAFRTFCSCSRTQAGEGTMVIALGGGYRTLTAVLGVDQASPVSGQVQITMRDVATNRVLLARTVGFTAAVPVSVDVTGLQRVQIEIRGALGGVTGVVGEPRAQP